MRQDFVEVGRAMNGDRIIAFVAYVGGALLILANVFALGQDYERRMNRCDCKPGERGAVFKIVRPNGEIKCILPRKS